MHMADALLSPSIGGTMWAATALTTIYCSRKVSGDPDDRKIPLMGVMGAFVFTAQMINFTIPGTGSSGHFGGGILLAALLGPHASFLVMASVLTVQALFFADGGLLALGCNIINLGFFPCLISYPLIYKCITARSLTSHSLMYGSLISAIIGLQLGSLAVVAQTYLSGVTELSFRSFLFLMQPIHLVIGFFEGIITAGIIAFIWRARPEIISRSIINQPLGDLPIKRMLTLFLLATLFTVVGGGIYVSSNPDGLEWAFERSLRTNHSEKVPSDIHEKLADLQNKTAVLPGYKTEIGNELKGQPAVGVIGGVAVLAIIVFLGVIIKLFKQNHCPERSCDDS